MRQKKAWSGFWTIVVVGKGLANGTIEVKDRKTGVRTDVPVGDIVAHLLDVCRE